MKRIMIVFLVLVMAIATLPASSLAFRGNGGHGGRGSGHGGGAVNNHRDGNRGYGYHRGGGNFWPGVGTGIGAAIIYDTVVRPRYRYSPPPVYVVPVPPIYVQPAPVYVPTQLPDCNQYRTKGEQEACQRGLNEAEVERQKRAESEAYNNARNYYRR